MLSNWSPSVRESGDSGESGDRITFSDQTLKAGQRGSAFRAVTLACRSESITINESTLRQVGLLESELFGHKKRGFTDVSR